jgi:hypothetical protein
MRTRKTDRLVGARAGGPPARRGRVAPQSHPPRLFLHLSLRARAPGPHLKQRRFGLPVSQLRVLPDFPGPRGPSLAPPQHGAFQI